MSSVSNVPSCWGANRKSVVVVVAVVVERRRGGVKQVVVQAATVGTASRTNQVFVGFIMAVYR